MGADRQVFRHSLKTSISDCRYSFGAMVSVAGHRLSEKLTGFNTQFRLPRAEVLSFFPKISVPPPFIFCQPTLPCKRMRFNSGKSGSNCALTLRKRMSAVSFFISAPSIAAHIRSAPTPRFSRIPVKGSSTPSALSALLLLNNRLAQCRVIQRFPREVTAHIQLCGKLGRWLGPYAKAMTMTAVFETQVDE